MNEKESDIIKRLNGLTDQFLSGKPTLDLDIGDIDAIEDEGLRSLARKLIHMGGEYKDCYQFIIDLSHGKLNTPVPRMNTFASPFKQLHSELRHLTWQIQQIASGDYSQKVSFSGDFSDAINTMIGKLRERHELWQQIRENEAQLRQYAEKLDESNKTKDKLFSIIAHDLKGHFNVLMGFGELLARETKKSDVNIERIEEFSAQIHTSATRAFSLLVNLLDWARLQSDHIVVTPESLNLNEVILENVYIEYAMAESKGIHLKYMEGGGDYPIVSDRAMINTILRNLISNAIKYTPQGGQIIVRVEVKNGNKYVVSVQDSGMGIPKDTMNKLFGSGDINSTPGTANEKGTGLGLILCKDFVSKLGGEIWAESMPEIGTIFSFSLADLS